MKQKMDRLAIMLVVKGMEDAIEDGDEAVLVSREAKAMGYNHLSREETESVLNRFVNRHPKFSKFQLFDPMKPNAVQSLFTTAYVALDGEAGAILLGDLIK